MCCLPFHCQLLRAYFHYIVQACHLAELFWNQPRGLRYIVHQKKEFLLFTYYFLSPVIVPLVIVYNKYFICLSVLCHLYWLPTWILVSDSSKYLNCFCKFKTKFCLRNLDFLQGRFWYHNYRVTLKHCMKMLLVS